MSKKTKQPDDAAGTTGAIDTDTERDTGAAQVTSGPPNATASHPFATTFDDLVVVEVLADDGVRFEGNIYHKGQTLTLSRGRAIRSNQPDRQVFRVLTTVRYANDPDPDASYEQRTVPGPLEIS